MGKIGIVGSGLIGRSWAMLFAAAGYEVVMYDVDESALDRAFDMISNQMKEFEKAGLLRGSLSADEQLKLIRTTRNMAEAVADAKHVQECVYEDAELKNKVFKEMCRLCNSDSTVLSSSCSCIVPSKIFAGLDRISQCIISHPCNPPALCPLTEIVPHAETSPDVLERTLQLMREIGQSPVTVKKEIDGFVSNRIQYSIINECWRLVQDGYISVEDIDTVMKDGIGMRYALMGPFETCHLNADGITQYMDKYAETIKRVSLDFGPVPKYSKESVAAVSKEITQRIPDTRKDLEERRKWRDNFLVEVAKLKKSM